jgi:cytochrome c553
MNKITLSLVIFSGAFYFNQAHSFDGDAEAGKAKVITCVACHGAEGNKPLPNHPKLAGQHAKYLFKQLKEFKLGAMSGGKEGRPNPIMGGMSMALSEQDMKDISAYFASLNMEPGSTAEDVIELGGQLYKSGDAERGIPACAACHGPRGNGTSLAGFPKVSFQNADYVKVQLESFRSGGRYNDMNGMMRDISMKLTDKDIELLSKYISGLH